MAALLAAVLAAAALLSGRAGPAAAQTFTQEPMPQTDMGVPAEEVVMIGATPSEAGAPGGSEVWGVGHQGRAITSVLVRYTSSTGWTLGPALPEGFQLDGSARPLSGEMTPAGSGVLVGTKEEGTTHKPKVLLVRRSGGAFEEAPAPTNEKGESLLKGNEELFGTGREPDIAALDEEGGGAGALLVPENAGEGTEAQVLHFDGKAWSSEPIEIPAQSSESFRVLALAASSPHNAWLLASLSANYPAGSVALFRRVEESGKWKWKPVALTAGGGDGAAHPLMLATSGGPAPLTVAGASVPVSTRGPALAVTEQGVWVTGERGDVHTLEPDSATLFFAPEGSAGGHVAGSWCVIPTNGASACEYEVPEPLPRGTGRTIAWSGGGQFGTRVITGLPDGVSLRLEGTTFKPVLSLGGGVAATEDPGAEYGAAFTEPNDGWLGLGSLPIHLAPAERLQPSKLTPWPVPFRHPLLALAPAPGQAPGALSSEALAVGSEGAVARYHPGEGWLPESLFGIGQKVQTPTLRAVAWPTPTRAYAVGDEGAMWLWRGETGLWEPDPAIPINFRGNLLGIAFDPANPARGYAIGTDELGEGGFMLRYGKTWTPETALPEQAQGAELVAIAFAGSEVIVAYRRLVDAASNKYVGGLIVNDGSGWRLDQEATELMTGSLPEAVAGLPDGGAAFVTIGGATGSKVYERQGPGQPWGAVAEPLSSAATGALALFREGGALRAVVTGGGGVGNQSAAQQSPPGSAPPEQLPLPLTGGPMSGAVMRQTASGWNDERHEISPVTDPEGGYASKDLPYLPDEASAVLLDPSSGQGWVVGGTQAGAKAKTSTGDVERYQSEYTPPVGEAKTEVGIRPEPVATIAFGGHAECAAPCAARSLARLGPPTSLANAVRLVQEAHVHSFVYTGPSVTAGQILGLRSIAIPFQNELDSYATIMAPTAQTQTYVVPTTQDLDSRPEREGSEQAFDQAFGGFPQTALEAGNKAPAGCAATVGCESSYYAFSSEGTRVIVLDESSGIDAQEIEWLEGELKAAAETGEPAIAVGSSNLAAEIEAHEPDATAAAQALLTGSTARTGCSKASPCDSASAYFFDSPEEDMHEPLAVRGVSVKPIEEFGSGTLGYVRASREVNGNFHGASGILLGEVETSKRTEEFTNRAPVDVRLVPVIGELALEGKEGTLLRRSQSALFDGLARRPRAGGVSPANVLEPEIDPYIPIPSICVGNCSTAVAPEYEFRSSRPDIGAFVKLNTASTSPLAVEQNASGEPERSGTVAPSGEQVGATSGLFCAFNHGETVVSVVAGGLTYSLTVHVEAGSVRQPCGTTPLKELPTPAAEQPAPPPAPAGPSPASAAPASSPPPVLLPAPPAAVVPPPAARPAAALPPFLPQVALSTPLIPFVPPPVPTPARPTPPSGTSAVTSPVEAVEKEEEEEEATESVSNQAVAYRSPETDLAPEYVLGAAMLAAFAGASLLRRRRPRTGRRGVEIAPVLLDARQREDLTRRRRRW